MENKFKFNTAHKQLKHNGKIRDVIIGRVYMITNTTDDMIYIGSTSLTLVKRWGNHMYEYNRNTQMKLIQHMRSIGIDKFEMELLELKVVNNIRELKDLEQKYINRYKPEILLNSRKASMRDIKYQESVKIVKPIIEDLIDKIFDIKINNISDNKKEE